MTIEEKAIEIVDAFSIYDDWMDKYNYLIEMGKGRKPIYEEFKTEQNMIRGCQSQVWLNADYRDGKVYFTADSDAIITKGIVNLLITVLDGQSPDNIINYDMSFLDKIGLKEHLSPNRANGINSMIKQMKLYALAFKTKSNLPEENEKFQSRQNE